MENLEEEKRRAAVWLLLNLQKVELKEQVERKGKVQREQMKKKGKNRSQLQRDLKSTTMSVFFI